VLLLRTVVSSQETVVRRQGTIKRIQKSKIKNQNDKSKCKNFNLQGRENKKGDSSLRSQ